MMWYATLVLMGAVLAQVAGSLLAMYFDAVHHFDAQALGVGIGATCGGYGTVAAGVGVFRRGDRDRPREP
jgi:hypothetical protein